MIWRRDAARLRSSLARFDRRGSKVDRSTNGRSTWTAPPPDGTHIAVSCKYRSFGEFWPFYLREHSMPRTRALHYIGTSLVIGIAIVALVTGRWWLLMIIPLAGYGFAWVAHFRVENNRPATFTYPLWSLAADFKMWWLWLTGRLQPELEKAGVRQ